MKILAVDDEEDTRRFLTDLLTQEGHDVVTASTGLEALAAVQIHRFDVVLLDLMMPEVDGYKVIRSMTDHWVNVRVPVVVISCRRDARSRSFARIFGCARYLEKPFKPEDLIEALRDIDQGRQQTVAAV
ncbi:MAG TPA: response regulator [Planctomycetota bacterium]|nr:response regulator [Planctomycetota bacterium]